MVVLTGDTHGRSERIEAFCAEFGLTEGDMLVILGDAGINYWLNEQDEALKERLSRLPVTLLCIHGNHKERSEEIPGYTLAAWRSGQVWVQPEHPDLLFAGDGEIYNFGGKKAIAIGGAYSADKYYRIAAGLPWFPTEQPDERVRRRVESALNRVGWRVDCVFSHTVPLSAMPRHAFCQPSTRARWTTPPRSGRKSSRKGWTTSAGSPVTSTLLEHRPDPNSVRGL